MNGATAEPCASTIRIPSSSIIAKIGHSQYFFRTRMNAHNSLSISIAFFLELVGHRIGSRAGGLAHDPVRLCREIPLQAQWILAQDPQQRADRGKNPVKKYAQRERADQLAQQDSQLDPIAVEPAEERRPCHGGQRESRRYADRPPARRPSMQP